MKVVDLFAGCGGLSLGFEKSGFEVVAAFDYWKESCDVYAANFNHPIHQVDLSCIEDYDIFKKWEPDIIIGGPPCQDFSSAGKRDESLGRADLTISYANIISNVRPEWFVMENVERILKSNVLRKAIEIFKNSGYGISYTVLDASYCGVPQARKRFIMVGHLNSKDGFLDYYLSKNQSKKPLTVYEYFEGKLDIEYYYRHPRSYARRGIFSVHEPSPTIRGVNRPIPKGYPKHSGDPCDPSDNVRPLTTLERSFIQTFPENFVWLGSKTHREQMIGNAVPVNLGKYVADCIAEYITDPNKKPEKDRLLSQQLELFQI
ncbi:DNA cytosine methyltransferase [Telluribacter sp. SYSU D00476]|uniref:DNA cytosine methyltransferase n=1 Tax=Telluribacter sp. SYSU D00476 TaxID=2811430 RepID=UPI001FF402CE|nr:DNA cytosine methyltransferase [Telluribacter sp. SYSU D00476]